MQERATGIGAELEITSQVNQGTHIHLRWFTPFSKPVLLDEKDEK